MIYCLGGVKQVGRSCFIVVTSESKIMLDCGINPGENHRYMLIHEWTGLILIWMKLMQ